VNLKKQQLEQAQRSRVCDKMPRKAPKEVVEHRITLGDFERKQLVQAIDAYQVDKIAENVPNYIIGIAGLGAAGALGVVAYAFYKWCDLEMDIGTAAKSWAMDLDNGFTSWITGNPMYSAYAEADQATTAQEVLDAYNPPIEKLEAQIEAMKAMKDFPNKALFLRGLYKRKGQLELLRRVALTKVGGFDKDNFPDGNPYR
jgi:hypothetical protein